MSPVWETYTAGRSTRRGKSVHAMRKLHIFDLTRYMALCGTRHLRLVKGIKFDPEAPDACKHCLRLRRTVETVERLP